MTADPNPQLYCFPLGAFYLKFRKSSSPGPLTIPLEPFVIFKNKICNIIRRSYTSNDTGGQEEKFLNREKDFFSLICLDTADIWLFFNKYEFFMYFHQSLKIIRMQPRQSNADPCGPVDTVLSSKWCRTPVTVRYLIVIIKLGKNSVGYGTVLSPGRLLIASNPYPNTERPHRALRIQKCSTDKER
jgi:hypothetical protein